MSILVLPKLDYQNRIQESGARIQQCFLNDKADESRGLRPPLNRSRLRL
jgi:hypothetical protein